MKDYDVNVIEVGDRVAVKFSSTDEDQLCFEKKGQYLGKQGKHNAIIKFDKKGDEAVIGNSVIRKLEVEELI